MFRYLRTQAAECSAGDSKAMLLHGKYTFPKTQSDPDLHPQEAPQRFFQALEALKLKGLTEAQLHAIAHS